MINNLEIINIWLDEKEDFGIVEVENEVLGSVFCPIESYQYSHADYNVINHNNCQSYWIARKIIHPYLTGRLSKLRGIKYIDNIRITNSE